MKSKGESLKLEHERISAADDRATPAVWRGSLSHASFADLGILSAVLGLVTACSLPLPQAQPDPTRYFILPAKVGTPAAADREKTVVVRLKSVEVPAYLGDKPLAVRRGGNEIRYLDTARWAEPLDQDLARNVLLGLGSLPGVTIVSRYDTSGKWDFDLTIRVVACEGTEDKAVLFTVNWQLEPNAGSALTGRTGTFEGKDLTWDGKSPEMLVNALGEGVTQFCDALANALKPSR